MGTACQSCRSEDVLKSLSAIVKERKLEQEYQVSPGGCQGNCAQAPLVSIQPEDLLYSNVKPSDGNAIIDSTKDTSLPSLYCDIQAPFFAKQKRMVTEYRGLLNPDHIEDYIALGGYTALLNAVTTMTPQEIIQKVMQSGLRGRGGAGYPTGLNGAQ